MGTNIDAVSYRFPYFTIRAPRPVIAVKNSATTMPIIARPIARRVEPPSHDACFFEGMDNMKIIGMKTKGQNDIGRFFAKILTK